MTIHEFKLVMLMAIVPLITFIVTHIFLRSNRKAHGADNWPQPRTNPPPKPNFDVNEAPRKIHFKGGEKDD